ncbi:hypothetical protein NDU88_003142 [Pleurodeles waltl]|uniref:Uncharacterized protein n=1 Tax=Pleurodeles waltl TaxID=8319 RepID=A0AAV7PG40_PLEWA|nr:hypothetical protein NDU88_003142 [Pleurodeles waltl]
MCAFKNLRSLPYNGSMSKGRPPETLLCPDRHSVSRGAEEAKGGPESFAGGPGACLASRPGFSAQGLLERPGGSQRNLRAASRVTGMPRVRNQQLLLDLPGPREAVHAAAQE